MPGGHGTAGVTEAMPDEEHLSPGAARRRLGTLLKQLRAEADLRLGDAGGALQRSAATLSRLENGKSIPRLVDVNALLDAYASARPDLVGPETRERILLLASESRKQEWFSPFRDVLTGDLTPDHVQRYIEYETDARELRSYEPEVVPGLLQTPDYARAIIGQFFPDHAVERRERLVELRMERQRTLARKADSFRFSAIVGEAALHKSWGSPKVMRAQLEALAEETRAGRPNFDVRVAPVDLAIPQVIGGPFIVMLAPDANDRDMVYLETRGGADYSQNEANVRRYIEDFDVLYQASYDPDASFAAIQKMIDTLS